MSAWARKGIQESGVEAETSDRERTVEGRSDWSLVYGR